MSACCISNELLKLKSYIKKQSAYGGPLICPGNDHSTFLVGIAANVKRSCTLFKKAGIFTNIGPYRDWIERMWIEKEYIKSRKTNGSSAAFQIIWIPFSVTMLNYHILF